MSIINQVLSFFRQLILSDFYLCTIYAFLLFFVFGFLYNLIQFLKFRIKISRECWFCIKKNSVYLAYFNSFTCVHCQQYNGFSKDGSYNKKIEKQYEINKFGFCQRSAHYASHSLCNSCNKNQEIKIKLLADFVPLNEENFDKEVVEFRKNLESVYKICESCEQLIYKVLDKPASPNVRKAFSPLPTLNLDGHMDYDIKPKFSEIFISNMKSFLAPTLPLGFFIIILSLLIYLFNLSNYCYLFQFSASYNPFKKNFNEDYVNVYEHSFLLTISSATLIYVLLSSIRKTIHFIVDLVTVTLFVALICNHVKFNMFSLVHDVLIECHQLFLVASMVCIILNIFFNIYKCFIALKLQNSTDNQTHSPKNGNLTTDKKMKLYKFNRFEDDTTNIREQIQDLSLTDFSFTNSIQKGHNSPNLKSFSKPFESESMDYDDGYHYKQMFTSPKSISYFQYKYTNSMASSDSFLYGQAKHQAINNNSEKYFSNKTQNYQYPSRVLNYFINYEQKCQSNNIIRETNSQPSTKIIANWLLYMFHTFEVILFLVIIGLLIVLLSMPIKMSYNSDFNSFEFNFAIYNVSSE